MVRVSTRISLRSLRLRTFLSEARPMAEPGIRAKLNSKVEWDPTFSVLRSINADELSLLRQRCDVYMDPRKSLCEVTHFYVDGFSAVRDWAKAALNVYNEKEQKNFFLQKVAKLNQVSMDAYLTFWARSAESDELRLFRAVVKPLGGYNVLLSEIKDDNVMTVPFDHEEYYPRIPRSEEDHSPYTCGSADSLVDASGSSAVGEGCADLGSVGWDHNFEGYCTMEGYEVSDLRHLCDFYIDPRTVQYGGGATQFYVDGISAVRDRAKAALNVYNEKKQKNFHLKKVVKLNPSPKYFYITFWAESAESDEHHLFRGVVDLLDGDKVLLCEIKDDDEMMIPAEHEEKLPHEQMSEEDCSPPRSPYTWFDIVNGSADGGACDLGSAAGSDVMVVGLG